jgi:hypothetical protein
MHNKEISQLFSKVKMGTKVIIANSKKSFNQLAASHYKNIDFKAPSVPTVTVSDKSSEVSGKTEKGATVTVKIGSKKYTAKPADSKGKFKVKIPKQKAGKKLYLSVKDKAGNISNTKTVIVKDKTAPVLSGVSHNKVYNKNVTISFKEGKATVDRKIVKTKTVVKTEGKHTVVLTDKAGNKTTVAFTIDKTAPVVSGVIHNKIYNKDVTLSFREGKATLNGKTVRSGTIVRAQGKHTVVITDAVGNKRTIVFGIDKTAPVVSGVSHNGIYNKAVKITFNEGTATLNGKAVKTGTVVNVDGKYTVVVTDAGGNKRIVVFTIDKTAPVAPTVITVPDATTTEITGTAEAKSTITIKVGSTVIGTGTADQSGNFKVVITPQASTTILNVTATDASKNISEIKQVEVK